VFCFDTLQHTFISRGIWRVTAQAGERASVLETAATCSAACSAVTAKAGKPRSVAHLARHCASGAETSYRTLSFGTVLQDAACEAPSYLPRLKKPALLSGSTIVITQGWQDQPQERNPGRICGALVAVVVPEEDKTRQQETMAGGHDSKRTHRLTVAYARTDSPHERNPVRSSITQRRRHH